MKTAPYKLAVLVAAVSLSLFSAGSLAKDGETPTYPPTRFDASKVGTFDRLGKEIKLGNQCRDNDGVAGDCRNAALDYLYDKTKDYTPEKLAETKKEAIQAGQNAANNAEANANTYTDNKITENNNGINLNIRNQSISDREYTDNKVRESNTRTDGLLKTEQEARIEGNKQTLTSANQHTDKLIAKEQKDRDKAIEAEQQARIQGDLKILDSVHNYTDHRIRGCTPESQKIPSPKLKSV